MQIVIVGGGIGGLTAALALARGGHRVRVLEREPEFAELGAGLQLAPNATSILGRLGVLDRVLEVGVLPRRLLLRSIITAEELSALDLGASFMDRYGAPYVVVHRSDLLTVLHDACLKADVELRPGKEVRSVTGVGGASGAGEGVGVLCADGTGYSGDVLVGADGLRSVLRERIRSDEPVGSGFAAYRGTASVDEVAARSALDEVVAWIGPRMHFVQYPLRAGEIYNQVAVFGSPRYAAAAAAGRRLPDSEWGTPDELDEAFSGCAPQVRAAMSHLWRDRWWPMYDREPISTWVDGGVALLGDAAHPMLQYLAQGACQAIEDADALASALAACPGPQAVGEALGEYQAVRAPRAARVQRAARTWGDIWHLSGAGLLVRDELLRNRAADDYTYTDWLYAPARR
jgi:salicylate hydroxylase